MVVQAEHGPDGLAWLVTWSEAVADAVTADVARIVEASPRRADIEATLADGGYAVLVDGPEQAMAVANAIAPEHLELLTADPEALLPLVRHAGAVFCGPWAPASVGDYLAGPNHVLPTYGSARFASALRVDDFLQAHPRRHRSTKALARLARTSPPWPRLRACPPTPNRCGCDPMAPALRHRRPIGTPRPTWVALTGYHSAQVDVEVRLNTNESPSAARPAWLEALEAGMAEIEFNRYPDRRALALREALADSHGVPADQVFCANGSNEVLQSLLPGLRRPWSDRCRVRAHLHAARPHRPRITGTVGGGRRRRTDDFALDLDEVARVLDAAPPGHHLPLLAEQPDRAGRARRR